MNYVEYDTKRQRNIELIVLIICTLYAISFMALIMAHHWETWDLITVVVFFVLTWMFYLLRYKDYRFRAYLTYGMFQLSMLLYLLHVERIEESFSSMVAATLIIVLYGLPKLINITLIAYTFELMYHLFISKSLYFTGTLKDVRLAIQIATLYIVQFVVYSVIQRQGEVCQEKDTRIEELKDAERSRDDFLANVSHEIRTPINTICGMSDTILREHIPEQMREEVFSIQNAGQNLLSVVSDILDFSELQADHVELEEEEYCIASLANDVIHMSAAKKADKPIELVLEMDPTLPSVMVGDEQKIRRVIMNLVSNAIKFTEEGAVSICISYRKEDYGVNLTVTVKDSGIGMRKEHIEKIFTVFSQVDSKRNRQEGGIGLGLAISKAIINKMGGFMSVQSEFGKGSRLQFTIPQKVVDWEPTLPIRNPKELHVAVYIDMEQFERMEIRDAYANFIRHIVTQAGVSCSVCRNLLELKRKIERAYFTHVFISVKEYLEKPGYFDQLAKQISIVVVLDRFEEEKVVNPGFLRIYKPLSTISVIRTLNGETTVEGINQNTSHRERFEAPEARILAVDDNRMNLKVLENLLKPYKIQLIMAESGAKALECLEKRDFDLVFMDHMMPEMDGIEALRRIRSMPGKYYKMLPVVALTANAVSGMREMFLSEGFSGFLAKPIELSALERILRRFIPEKKLVQKEENNENPSSVRAESCEVGQRGETRDEQWLLEELEKHELDPQKGILYCGSLEGYMEVLQMHRDDGWNNRDKLEELYEKKDWNEYAIYVHALKSSMMSIGAIQLSDMAKKLESAAKAMDVHFIMSFHAPMMQEYKRILEVLESLLTRDSDTEDECKMNESRETKVRKELSEEAFDRLAETLEEAVYALDHETMQCVVDELEDSIYCGVCLDAELESIRKKLEMEDYMSALSAVLKMKERLSQK